MTNVIRTETLANGAVLLHRHSTASRVVSLQAVFPLGSRDEEPSQLGATNMMMSLLGRGSTQHTADELAERMEDLGISFSRSAGQDHCAASLTAVDDDFSAGIALFTEAVREANFPWEELDTLKGRVSAEIRMRDDQTPSFAIKRFRRELFQPHAYGRPVEGELATVADLDQVTMVQRHRTLLDPRGMVIAAVGPVDWGSLKHWAERISGEAPATTSRVESKTTLPPRSSRIEIEKRVAQGFIVSGFVVCGVRDEDCPALIVAKNVLGGGMSSRLFVNLRDRKGLAYSVGASAGFFGQHGYFFSYIGTAGETLAEAESGIHGEHRQLVEEIVPEEELERARNYIIGNYLRDLETHSAQAGRLALDVAQGLGAERGEQFPTLIRNVTARDVLRVANRYFTDPVTVVVRPVRH